MPDRPGSTSISRRELLQLGGAAATAAAAGGAGVLLSPVAAQAQTPKRGGILRLTFQSDPVTGFDPQQTISFVTQVPLSFVYSRLVKVKAGPSVKPMTYPIEPDLAESWTQPNETTYVFKLKKGVRWHNKPPVNGRELTADDVKYTYDRFLTVKATPTGPCSTRSRTSTPSTSTRSGSGSRSRTPGSSTCWRRRRPGSSRRSASRSSVI